MAIVIPYSSFKKLESLGVKSVPNTYNRYKGTIEVNIPGFKANGKSVPKIYEFLLAKKIEESLPHILKNRAAFRYAADVYKKGTNKTYSSSDLESLDRELRQPTIFNPETIKRISKDIGVDITKDGANKEVDKIVVETLAENRRYRNEAIKRQNEEAIAGARESARDERFGWIKEARQAKKKTASGMLGNFYDYVLKTTGRDGVPETWTGQDVANAHMRVKAFAEHEEAFRGTDWKSLEEERVMEAKRKIYQKQKKERDSTPAPFAKMHPARKLKNASSQKKKERNGKTYEAKEISKNGYSVKKSVQTYWKKKKNNRITRLKRRPFL